MEETGPRPADKFFIVLLVAGLAVLAIGGVFWAKSNTDTQGDIKIYRNKTEDPGVLTASNAGEIVIDISGAVEKPGVYKIPNNSRISQALITAGGLAQEADRDYVSKHINLAQPLSDGEKLYVPFRDDRGTVSGPISAATPGTVNINNATAAELDTLPGVGPVTADKIIAGRPYKNTEELLSRKAVSSSVFAKLKDKISVY